MNTAAAKTIAALATEIAGGRGVTLGVPTVQPGATQTMTPVRLTSATPTPPSSSGSVATNTPEGTAVPCNRARFLRDATIPDESTILPNSLFTKTWELENTGTCSWNNTYTVVFAGRGTSMSGPATSPLVPTGEVRPGEKALVSVTLRAPNEPGTYEGYWMLRSGDGKTFGTGANAGSPFFVKVRVAEEYSFAEHACSAKWSSGAGELLCPGSEGDSKGYALPLEDPTLENNEKEEGRAILMVPNAATNGYIVGTFPPVIVPSQADFRSTISCPPNSGGCYVRFKITYRVDNGDEQVLGEWNEGFEGGVTQAIKDLDTLAGRSVAFSLYVSVAGDVGQSKGIWFFPRIVK